MSLRLTLLILSLVALCLAGTRLSLSADQQNEIVQYFNVIRSQVDPPAANMQAMVWDAGVADNAWAAVFGTNQGVSRPHNVTLLVFTPI